LNAPKCAQCAKNPALIETLIYIGQGLFFFLFDILISNKSKECQMKKKKKNIPEFTKFQLRKRF